MTRVSQAFTVVCAVVDADGRHADDELWALITTFAPLLDSQLAALEEPVEAIVLDAAGDPAALVADALLPVALQKMSRQMSIV